MRWVFFLIAAGLGFWYAQQRGRVELPSKTGQLEKEYPISEYKSFVLCIYAHNQEGYIEKALSSVFAQEYDYYRVIFIDDASLDKTFAKAQEFASKNNQTEKITFFQTEEKEGLWKILSKIRKDFLDKEIVLILEAKDWFSSPLVLFEYNKIYQNPDVWMSVAGAILYPSYTHSAQKTFSFYSKLLKELPEKRLGKKDPQKIFPSIVKLAEGKVRVLPSYPLFLNEAPQRETSWENPKSPAKNALLFCP